MIGLGLLIMAEANLPVSGLPLSLPLPRGRDVITIASALNPDGCDVIASLPSEGAAKPRPYQRPPCGGLAEAMSSHPYPLPDPLPPPAT
jgi:hypothetical protein